MDSNLDLISDTTIFGTEFVEKIMISLSVWFESKIKAIQESFDLKTLFVAELISKLQAQEQISSIRHEDVAQVAF
uniref:Uncharacterized protein n=1 Tax=Solanum lycopersicum TaxID=4081 RepID=A0A3Q7EY95_SOLLC